MGFSLFDGVAVNAMFETPAWRSGFHRRPIFGAPGERLARALVGAVLPDDARALFRRREFATQRDPRFAAKGVERHGGAELYRLDVIAAAVVIAESLGLHDLVEGDAVVVVAAVRAMHDKAPDATGLEVEDAGRCAKAVRPLPLRQMLRVGPHRPHQFA